jgi:amino acid adenylation domain-containing protein
MLPGTETAAHAVRVTSVPELVAEHAAKYPHRVAVTADGESLTYGELDARASRLAARLVALGVGTDVLVGLCLPRSIEMVVSALAILKAGGAYMPLDPANPTERSVFMLEDAQAAVLVTTPELAPQLDTGGRPLVLPDGTAVPEAAQATAAVAIAPDHLAYVIYTSGSTGRPKGVEITHRGLTNLVSWHNETFRVTAEDRASHVAGLGFDAAVWELWPYLAAGASVHLAGEVTRNSAELLKEWLVARKITIGFIPTVLVEYLVAPDCRWPPTTSLRLVLTGGDALHRYPPSDLPFSLINNYGPTECTVVATSGPVLPNPSSDTLPSIGRAITNVQVHLLNESLHPVPSGATGEIYIGGAGVGRGYRNHAELTAEKFIPDPFTPGGRLYKTGDLGRQLADGQIVFTGRADDQLKVRGYRIEPNEISGVLNRHPQIRNSIVVAQEDLSGDKRLVAYVVLDQGRDQTHSGLRDYLRSFLPEYMLPAVFVRVDDFPLTPHGKVDRGALPVPDMGNMLQDDPGAAARTEIEQRVAEILGELLDLNEIDLDDNFFLLGGHSLLGAQLMARLRDAFGIEIGLRSLFEAPTVAALSVEVERLSLAKEPIQAPVRVRS